MKKITCTRYNSILESLLRKPDYRKKLLDKVSYLKQLE